MKNLFKKKVNPSSDDDNLKLFIENFKRVRDLGWVRSHRSHNTGIGKTLEDLMGVEENNLDEPDFGNIEIKSQRKYTSSYITLFTKAPSFPNRANTLLRDKYGIQNEDNPKIKKLHCSMFSSHFNNTYEKWGFRLRPSDTENKLFIDVKNLKSEVLDNNTIYYDYDVLKKTISHKLNVLAFVNTDNKTVDDEEHFHFTDCKIFYKCNFDKFISLISNDKIMYDIRIGSYKTGSNFGKVHDHGSGFRVKREDMRLVFSSVYDVE